MLLRTPVKPMALWLALWAVAPAAWALDLAQAYQEALRRDAQYLAAQARAQASEEALPQARAALLPSVGLSAQVALNDTVQTSMSTGASQNYNYSSANYTLSFRQAVFRRASVIQLDQAQAQVASAQATLNYELQQLAVRVSAAYFEVLNAQEALVSQQAQIAALTGQLDSAEKFLAAGRGTRTDLEEAKARLDLARATLIQLRNNVFVAERSLAAIYGQPVSAQELARLDPARMHLAAPDPDSLPQWLANAEDNNPELQAARQQLAVADLEIHKQQAAHQPTLDATVSRTLSRSEGITVVGSKYHTYSAGLMLTVPIYSGGGTSSAVRQALAMREYQAQNLEAVRRQLGINVSKEFSASVEGGARVQALQQATESAALALRATEKGWQAGTRHRIDILNAQQQLYATQLELVRARNLAVQSYLRLKAVSGLLTESDLQQVSAWMLAPKA